MCLSCVITSRCCCFVCVDHCVYLDVLRALYDVSTLCARLFVMLLYSLLSVWCVAFRLCVVLVTCIVLLCGCAVSLCVCGFRVLCMVGLWWLCCCIMCVCGVTELCAGLFELFGGVIMCVWLSFAAV